MLLELLTNETICMDIRLNQIRYVLSSYDKKTKTIVIKKYGNIDFDYDFLDTNNEQEKIEILKKFCQKEEIKTSHAYLNISSPTSIVRIIKMPYVKEQWISKHLELEINQYIPVDISLSVIDYKIVELFQENNVPMMNLMIIAVQNKSIEFCFKVFKKAGLDPLIVDLYPNAMSKLFGNTKFPSIAIIDVNEGTFDFEILKNGKLFMYSNVFIEKELLELKQPGLDIYEAMENNDIFKETIIQLQNYIKTYLKFYSSRHNGDSCAVAYFIGQIATMNGVVEYFNEVLNIPIVAGLSNILDLNLEKSIKLEDFEIEDSMKQLSKYACALGLSMRGGIL